MISISFSRESISPEDESSSGARKLQLQDDAVLGDLIAAVSCGGCGNDWPIPESPDLSCWAVRSDIGLLAYIVCENTGERKIFYSNYGQELKLLNSEVWSVFASRVRKDQIGIDQ